MRKTLITLSVLGLSLMLTACNSTEQVSAPDKDKGKVALENVDSEGGK